jgi:plasmid stabilization system protein ParE
VVEVTIHPAAEDEYQTALAWYYVRSPHAAERFEAAFDQAIEYIKSHPTMFPLCDDRHRFVLLQRYPYRLVYRVDGETVKVIAVVHSRRRPRFWSGRE